jgi:protein-tyrosine phosphatase
MKDMHSEVKSKNRIVVYCVEGIDRSPTVVTCYLIMNGMRRNDAWSLVKEKRPIAWYHGYWIDKLINLMDKRG